MGGMKRVLVLGRRLRPARSVSREALAAGERRASVDCRKETLYRAIERAQSFMHKQVPADAFMENVRRHYPAPLYFVESNRKALERAGLSRLDAFYYAMIPALTRTSLSQQDGARPRLDSIGAAERYLRTLYVGIHVECFYLLLLDRQGRLIRAALLQKGGVDNTPFYLNQLLAVALQEEARFLILAHNHPGGTRRPSKEDLRCTLRALEALMPLRVPMLDHFIVAGNDVISIRGTGMIPEMLWTAAHPGSRLVSGWLKDNLNNS